MKRLPVVKASLFVAMVMCLSILPITTHAQTDTLVDVFPLAVGNQWMYRYFTVLQQNGSGGLQTITDSGSAEYTIVDAIPGVDSTRWVFLRSRNLLHRHEINSTDTTYSIIDSSHFEIVERHEGQHHLYRNEYSSSIRTDVFPFTREFTDTTLIYRYRRVESGDSVTFRSAFPLGFPNPFYVSVFTYKEGTGQTRYSYNSGTLDVSDSADHYLIASVVSSIDDPIQFVNPKNFTLYQNYPNPFNPITTIQFSIVNRQLTILKVYDLLGREVATLVNEKLNPGSYQRTFSGEGLPSGVYFYRLRAGEFTETRKLLLLR